jgi:predicted transcriptional regulator of viral defense system
MDQGLRRVARRQLALITHEQARRVLTANQIKHRVRRGELERVREGVLRVAGAPESWEQHLLAACLAGGPHATASFRSAAWHWRLVGFDAPETLEITVPRSRRARLPGVNVHDTRVTGRVHRGRHNGIPITTVARTLCDVTASVPWWVVEQAVDDALRRKLTSLSLLERVFLDLANKGRRRSTVMRAILEARLPGFDPGGSDPELKILR